MKLSHSLVKEDFGIVSVRELRSQLALANTETVALAQRLGGLRLGDGTGANAPLLLASSGKGGVGERIGEFLDSPFTSIGRGVDATGGIIARTIRRGEGFHQTDFARFQITEEDFERINRALEAWTGRLEHARSFENQRLNPSSPAEAYLDHLIRERKRVADGLFGGSLPDFMTDPAIDPRSSKGRAIEDLNGALERSSEKLRDASKELSFLNDELIGAEGQAKLLGGAFGDLLSSSEQAGGAGADALSGIERAAAGAEDGLRRVFPELKGLGETGEAVFDILTGGLRGVAFEGQGLLATLESIAERVRDLALDEVVFPFLKKELGGIFAAGEEGPGAAGDKVFGPAAEGLGTLAESARGGADALRETGLATAGVTSASGAAAGALVNELTAGALQTALATGTQSAASQSLTVALAAVTASANAASVALQGLTVSAGGGGGAGGGILGSLLGTATGGGFDPGVGPGGLGFLHFGGPRQFGGPVSAGTLFETHGLGRREFFIPNVDGAIVPGADIPDVDMARLRILDIPNTSGGGAGAPAIQQHVTINNTFQGRFTRREAQDLLHVADRMDQEAINGLRRNVNRGGPDAQLFGRRAKR